MLNGCGTRLPPASEPPQLLLERCAPVSDATTLEAELRAPLAGALRIDVGEHGVAVSVTATPDRGAPLELRSPVARNAWHVLLLPVGANEHLALRIASEDLAPAGGMACVRAQLLRSHSPATLAAEAAARDLMAAGRASAAGEWPAALEDYRRGARRLDAGGQTLGAAQAWLAMAMIDTHYLDRGLDAIAVISTARDALAAAGLEARAGPFLAQLLSMQAEALMDLPDLEANDARVQQLLEGARRAVLPATPEGAREVPRIDTIAGYWSFVGQDWSVARADFARAADACTALVDPECAARAYQNLASLAEREQRPELAEREYRRALAALPADRSPRLAADIEDNLSQLHGSLGLVSQAERLATEALRLHALAGDCEGGRRSLDGIGTLLAQVGDADAARAYLHTALLECRPLLEGIAPGVPFDPRARAQIADDCRPPGSAARDGETATGVARAVVALTTLDLASGDVSAARACMAAAAPLQALKATGLRFAIAEAEADLTAGDAAAAYGRLVSARSAARARHLPAGNRLRRQIDLDTAHALLDLGRPAEAWLRASRALREGAARSTPGELLESLRLAAMSLGRSGYPSPAISLLERGTELAARVPVANLDPEAAAAFVASQHALYSDLTELESRAGFADRALLSAESGRARAARAALARTRRNATGVGEAEGPAALLDLRTELAERLNRVELAPALTRGNAEAVSRALSDALAASAPPGPLDGDAEPGIAEVLRDAHELAPGSVVVEYAAAGDELVAFVLQGGTLQLRRLGTRAAITARATRFLALLQDPDTPASLLAAAGAELAQLIWWPLGLQRADSIMVVPEGAVSAVPLGALPWSAAERAIPVVARARISLIPSLRYAWDRRTTPPPRAPRGYAALGNPLFHLAEWQRDCTASAGPITPVPATTAWTERLAPLPDTATELRQIAQFAARFRRQEPMHLLQGCDATRGALRELAGSPLRLLHLATHARIDAERPRLSALALTPQWEGTELRNTLGYADIVALQLKARLVVLGACDTVRGEVLAGEGVLGPAQAFLQGGADSVVGTLWSVDDRLTASFMKALYQHLFADRMSVGEALQRTQIDFMAVPGGASSHFWAAFALYGEADAAI
jgi:tetratricopeptide (TPR) repeat protein